MPRISPEKLEIGMRLSKPLIGGNGIVLLGKGTELTERWIERILDMNIGGVYVEGESKPEMPLDEMLSLLEARFINVKDKPYMDLLKEAVREHIKGLYG